MTELLNLELSLLDGIQKYMSTPFFDKMWVFITHLGDLGLIWIAITIALLVCKNTRKIGIACAISLLLGVLITNGILKNLVARPRPYNFSDVKLLINAPMDFSFPSGHTTASFAVAFVLLKEKFKLGKYRVYIPIIILAILVAFSRMYLYVHFPSDILVGILVGYLCSILSLYIIKRLEKK